MIDTTPIPNALKELLFTPDYHRAKERYRVEHEGTDRMLRDLLTDTTKIAKIIVHKMIDDCGYHLNGEMPAVLTLDGGK